MAMPHDSAAAPLPPKGPADRPRPLTIGRLMLGVAVLALLFSVNVPTAKMVLMAQGGSHGFGRLVTIWVVETVLCYYVILAGYIVATWVPIPRARRGDARAGWRAAALRYGGLIGPGLLATAVLAASVVRDWFFGV